MGAARRWLPWLIGGYVVVWLLWRASLYTNLREHYWQIEVASVFAAWLYLPVLVLLAAALVTRTKLGLVLLAAPVLIFAADYGGQFTPNPRAVLADVPGHHGLQVMTWNAGMSGDGAGELRALLRTAQPDVVVVQEVSSHMSKVLTEELDDLYPYRSFVLPGASTSLGLLSRYPILEEDAWTDWMGCQCQRVVVDWGGQPITVINAHVWGPVMQLEWVGRLPLLRSFRDAHQRLTFDTLLAMVEAESNPVLLAGDFNTTEQQANYRRATKVMRDAFAEGGWGFGFTYPNPTVEFGIGVPLIRIDHIFYDRNWRAVHTRTRAIAGSDHLSVGTELWLREPRRSD